MEGGGGVVAFDVGSKKSAFALANALKVIDISNNLGDAKSLLTHPETTTHQKVAAEVRTQLGITPGLLRLSVGLEDTDDLCEDLDRALKVA
jgi:O-succinylhomoserine sulfhydrylase